MRLSESLNSTEWMSCPNPFKALREQKARKRNLPLYLPHFWSCDISFSPVLMLGFAPRAPLVIRPLGLA
jgi:hypothetical protein